jgi:hypothetical protein
MISYTVGDGGTFATWQLALAQISSLGLLPDNVTVTQISDVTETVNHLSTGIVSMNGFTVTLTSNKKHNGNPNDAWVTTLNAGIEFGQRTQGGSGTFRIDGLYFKRVAGGGATSQLLIIGWAQLPSVHLSVHEVKNCLFEGDDRQESAFDIAYDQDIIRFSNCKFWNLNIGIPIEVNTGTAGTKTQEKTFENCTVYGCIIGVSLDQTSVYTLVLRNVVSAGNINPIGGASTDWFHQTLDITNFSCYNCADSDGTLATIPFGGTVQGNLADIVPEDNFASLDDTNDRFLFPNGGTKQLIVTATPRKGVAPLKVDFTSEVVYADGGGVLHDGGMAPTLSSVDIAGVAIPDDAGNYPIGCHAEFYTKILPTID